MDRISFDQMAINLANEVSKRSEDMYKKVGCCILNHEGRILSTGYNGLAPKFNINKNFWNDRNERRKFMIHAEINALSRISRQETPYTLASTLLPCQNCAINIVAYGIKRVIYNEDYHLDDTAKEIFRFYNLELIRLDII